MNLYHPQGEVQENNVKFQNNSAFVVNLFIPRPHRNTADDNVFARVCGYTSLLEKYLMKHWTDLNETCRN